LRDWLAGFGPMRIDWGKGVVGMEHKGERIELQAESQLAEAQVCEHVEEISKKKKKNPTLSYTWSSSRWSHSRRGFDLHNAVSSLVISRF